MTRPEKILWAMLRGRQVGLRFRRQHPVGPFVLDFYCPSAKLAVEVDGPAHEGQTERDERRSDWLRREGIRVLRFSAAEVEARPVAVVAAITQAAPPSTGFAGPPPP